MILDRALLLGSYPGSDPYSGSYPMIPAVPRNIASLQHLLHSPRFGLRTSAVDAPRLEARDVPAILTKSLDEPSPPAGILVYFAGHGLVLDEEEELYLVLDSRTTFDNVREYGVRASGLLKSIADSNAKLRVLVLDCCNASSGLEAVLRKMLPDLPGQVTGTYAVAASVTDSAAQAPADEVHTAFTGLLVDILDRGIANGRDTLGLDEVFQSVRARALAEPNLPEVEILVGIKGQATDFALNPYYGWKRQIGVSPLRTAFELQAGLSEWLTDLGPDVAMPTQATLERLRALLIAARTLVSRVGLAAATGTPRAADNQAGELATELGQAEDAFARVRAISDAARRRQRRMRRDEANNTFSIRQLDDDSHVIVTRKRDLVEALEELRSMLRSIGGDF